jgi:hypothetical protein
MLTVAAAITLYLYPPRFAPAYTESGEQKLTLVNPATSEGRAYAKQWAQYAWLGPLMLILGFSAQLAAATFDAPFWTRLSPRHDGPSRFKGERAMSRRPLMVSLLVYLLSTGLLGWATGRWSEVIYFLTGLILIWYTLETREVRLATLRQTALQIRPFLAIEYGDERKIWVHNVGNGVARDIKFHDVRLSEGAEGATGFLTVEWKPIDFIPKGEKRELHSEGLFLTDQERRERHADQTEKWRANFGPHGKGQVYEFITDYSDLSGTPYRAAFRVHKGHTEVLRDEQYAGDGAGHHERTAR